ncbi:MAG: hypothetical protein ACRD9L_01780 [Bryobacteraceae bacterium]
MSTLRVWLGVLVLGAAVVFAQSNSWLKGTADERLDKLANIQPGLGVVMMESSARAGNLYHAAHAANWGMAAYQLKEMTEILEVAETTRPGRAGALQGFQRSALSPVARDIVNQDLSGFNKDFNAMVVQCNGCHRASGLAFIVYQVPERPATSAKLDIGMQFKKADLEKMLGNLLR